MQFHRLPENRENRLVFALNCSEIGNYYLNITYRDEHIIGSPFQFEITPGNFSHENSKILGFGSWIASLKKPNIIYVQILDDFSNEIIRLSTPTSLEFEKKENDDNEEYQIPEEIHNLIRIQIKNSRNQILENFEYKTEYIGKSTWGISYLIDSDIQETVFIGIYYDNNNIPIGNNLLGVFLQESGFPYPPNSYKMLGPYPAKPELLEVAPSAISSHPDHFRSYKLDKNGWLNGFFTSYSLSDTDYRAEFIGDFTVEEDGIFIFICLGVEHYTIDYPLLKSGDVWNIHQLSKGTHTLQVSTLAKRDWNFDFQCRFQNFYPLKSYISESLIPDFLINNNKFTGQFHILLQNLHTNPINDLDVKIIAINDTNISPIVKVSEKFTLYPQEFSFIPIEMDFTINEEKNYPKENFFIIIAIFSNSLKAKTQISFTVRIRDIRSQSFQYIFKDTDQTHQIATVKAPLSFSKDDIELYNNKYPVVLISHGGGVSSNKLCDLYPHFLTAWLLVPKGRCVIPFEIGPFSDTHYLSAIDGLEKFIINDLPENIPRVDKNSIVSIGSHYYGGLGALLLANYYPDRMLGVSADAGWIKHSKPNLNDFIHPMISGIIDFASIHNDFSFTTENFRGVPFFAGSGVGDTAGYPWRMFYQQTLLEKNKVEIKADSIVGLSYKKHPTAAFEPTQNVIDFISKRITRPKYLPKEFTVSSWNPSIYQGRGGVYISALQVPTQLASINVKIQGDLWLLNTTNTRTFDLHVPGNYKNIFIKYLFQKIILQLLLHICIKFNLEFLIGPILFL